MRKWEWLFVSGSECKGAHLHRVGIFKLVLRGTDVVIIEKSNEWYFSGMSELH